jgi:AraC-like DNA-binding protein
MCHFSITALLCLLSVSGYAQNISSGALPDGNIISKYRYLSQQQLLDTAVHYMRRHSVDTALACYKLLISTPAPENDTVQQGRVVEALNSSAIIYRELCDYRTSCEMLMKALALCEQYPTIGKEPKIYSNLGSIYFRFEQYGIAREHVLKALSFCRDTAGIILIQNNLGAIETKSNRIDSAFYWLNRAQQISRQHNSLHLYSIHANMASLFQKAAQYDSAFHYLYRSLKGVRKTHSYRAEYEVEILSSLANCFLETGNADSALHYTSLSNHLADENGYLEILAKNSLMLSQIEELKGRSASALKYYKHYVSLKDSAFNTGKFNEVSQLQRLFEISKTNRIIEEFSIDRQIKLRTIGYQRIILLAVIAILLLVSGILLYVFSREKRLNSAYTALVKKNIEIMELQEVSKEKYRKSIIPDDVQQKLLNRILTLMEENAVIYSTDFSIDRLAELVHSNKTHVSYVINTVLNMKFNTFLNGYRIREAQRLLSEPDAAKYTIEAVALRVGFKSRNGFSNAFKDVTGVSPGFYLKGMRAEKLNVESEKQILN